MAAERMDTLQFCLAARARGDHDLAQTVLDAALEQLGEGDAANVAQLWLLRADLALGRNDLATADDAARRAGPLAERQGASDVMAQAALRVGHVQSQAGDTSKARYWYGQAAELALRAELWPEALQAQTALAVLQGEQGETEAAVARLKALAEDADALGLPQERAACHVRLSAWALVQGQAEPAVAHLQEALRDPDALAPLLRGEAGLLRARLLLAANEPELAVTAVQEAVDLLRVSGNQHGLGAGLLLQGQMLLLVGAFEQAGRVLGEALAVTTQAGLPERAVVEAVIARATGGVN